MSILDPIPVEEPKPVKTGFWHRVRNSFLTGVVIASPIAITAYLAWLFITTIDDYITPLIPEKYNPETYLPFGIPGLGLIIVVVSLTLLGALAANFFGRILLRFSEKVDFYINKHS